MHFAGRELCHRANDQHNSTPLVWDERGETKQENSAYQRRSRLAVGVTAWRKRNVIKQDALEPRAALTKLRKAEKSWLECNNMREPTSFASIFRMSAPTAPKFCSHRQASMNFQIIKIGKGRRWSH